MSVFSVSKNVKKESVLLNVIVFSIIFIFDFSMMFFKHNEFLYGTLISLASMIIFSVGLLFFIIKKNTSSNFELSDYNKNVSRVFIVYMLLILVLVYFIFINTANPFYYVIGSALIPTLLILLTNKK